MLLMFHFVRYCKPQQENDLPFVGSALSLSVFTVVSSGLLSVHMFGVVHKREVLFCFFPVVVKLKTQPAHGCYDNRTSLSAANRYENVLFIRRHERGLGNRFQILGLVDPPEKSKSVECKLFCHDKSLKGPGPIKVKHVSLLDFQSESETWDERDLSGNKSH